MKDIFLVNYMVQGVKTLEKKITLSFYKKTIEKKPNTQNYNMKAIYGMNGSGKSAIVASVDILRNLLINPGYLNNPFVQKNLAELVSKKTGKIDISADFIANMGNEVRLYSYSVILSKNSNGIYFIPQRQCVIIKSKCHEKRCSVQIFILLCEVSSSIPHHGFEVLLKSLVIIIIASWLILTVILHSTIHER